MTVSQETQDSLWIEWHMWAANVAKKAIRGSSLEEDAVGEAQIALRRAIQSWDGVGEFKTFAYKFIHGSAIDMVRRWTGRTGNKVHAQLSKFLDTMNDEGDRHQSMVEPSCEDDRSSELLEHLDSRDKVIVEAYYFENLTDREIGERLGLSEPRINQLRNEAVEKMRRRL